MNIYIGGLQGVGKTTFGKELARYLQCPFFDVDAVILEQYGSQYDSVRALCKELGLAEFRRLEALTVLQLSKYSHTIVALGGGSLESTESQQVVIQSGVLFYLYASYAFFRQRLKQAVELPAYLNSGDPEAHLEQVYNKRHAIFEKLACITIPSCVDFPKENPHMT